MARPNRCTFGPWRSGRRRSAREHPRYRQHSEQPGVAVSSPGCLRQGGAIPASWHRSQGRFLQGELPLLPQAARQAQVAGPRVSAWEFAFSGADRSPSASELALFSRLNRYGLLLEIEQRQALLAPRPRP